MRLITAALIILLALPAHAIKILSVKSTKVLLDLEGDSLSVGDKLGTRDFEGRARGLMEIKQVKGNRAIALVLKGKVDTDQNIAKLGGSAGASKSTKSAKGKAAPSEGAWGFMAGYSNNSMEVKPTGGNAIEMSGSSFNLSGFYQMHIDGGFSARLLGGYETLSASGGTCGSSECSADIGYLGLQATVQYAFVQNDSMNVWVGAGLGFLFAMSKESNIVDTSKVSTNQTIVGSLGLDYKLSRDSFIPVQFDYAMFPDNTSSSATQMILRVGYGFSF